MHAITLLAIYSLVCAAMSLFGGWLPLVLRLTHRRMQIAISFVSGIILGIGLLHLLPHSYAVTGSLDITVWWMMGGFLFMFFLERFFHFHHHDVPDEMPAVEPVEHHVHADHDHADHGQGHAHGHGQHHGHDNVTTISWTGVIIGLTLHGLIDGLAVAAAVQAEAGEAGVVLAGIGTFMAVALHKPFDALTIGTLMAASGRSLRSRHLFNLAYALVTPVGIALFYALSVGQGSFTLGLGQTLGFAAGAFLCIATSDLLPELQFHRHDRVALSVALLVGIAVAWGTVFLESAGHDHAGHGHEVHGHEGHGHEGH